jgi:hypothetical protein
MYWKWTIKKFLKKSRSGKALLLAGPNVWQEKKCICISVFVQKGWVFAILQHGMDATILQIVGDSNLCDFWQYGSSDLPLVYVIWKYIHLGVCILQWHPT